MPSFFYHGNLKTADANLQFKPEKCKTVIVSKKKVLSFQKPDLEVDAWTLEHESRLVQKSEDLPRYENCQENYMQNKCGIYKYILSKNQTG